MGPDQVAVPTMEPCKVSLPNRVICRPLDYGPALCTLEVLGDHRASLASAVAWEPSHIVPAVAFWFAIRSQIASRAIGR